MFDYVNFTDVIAEPGTHDLKLFALSTCGFCKRAIAFLNMHKVSYSYVYIDRLSLNEKKAVKDEFYETFQARMVYPALIVDEKEYLIGFIEESWKSALSLK